MLIMMDYLYLRICRSSHSLVMWRYSFLLYILRDLHLWSTEWRKGSWTEWVLTLIKEILISIWYVGLCTPDAADTWDIWVFPWTRVLWEKWTWLYLSSHWRRRLQEVWIGSSVYIWSNLVLINLVIPLVSWLSWIVQWPRLLMRLQLRSLNYLRLYGWFSGFLSFHWTSPLCHFLCHI